MTEPGRLVYVVGPSGAGKDSILRWVRACEPPGVAFAHRYITRPADAGGENHVALSAFEFTSRLRSGAFALWWRANGRSYGIGVEIDRWREGGLDVVVNGSRAHLEEARQRYPDLLPVLITAPEERIARRLVERGREAGAELAERLRRNAELAATRVPGMVVIDNGGDLGRAGMALLRALAGEDHDAHHAAGNG